MSLEHPLSRDANISAIVNGQLVRENHGCGVSWIPSSVVPQGGPRENTVQKLMDHYNLNPDKAWSINRCSIPWSHEKTSDIWTMELRMEPREASIPGIRFVAEREGDNYKFVHPITDMEHVLTVREIESKELSQTHFQDETREYPDFSKP